MLCKDGCQYYACRSVIQTWLQLDKGDVPHTVS